MTNSAFILSVILQIEKPLQKDGSRLEANEKYCGSCFGAETVCFCLINVVLLCLLSVLSSCLFCSVFLSCSRMIIVVIHVKKFKKHIGKKGGH